VISVIKAEGGAVRIGIEAPRNVTVLRMEVFEKIQEENRESAGQGLDKLSDAIALFRNKRSKESNE